MLSIGKFGGHRTIIKERKGGRERLALINKVEYDKTLEDIRGGGKRRDRKENVFARPNGPRQNAETAISCRVPGPA